MPNVDWDALLDAALLARSRAYAPYSRYPVGAALLAELGVVYHGCNVENAAYSITMRAERTALGAAIAAGERAFTAMAVVADAERPVPPCGMCRQALFELAPDIQVLLANVHGDTRIVTPRELLPDGFTADHLSSANS